MHKKKKRRVTVVNFCFQNKINAQLWAHTHVWPSVRANRKKTVGNNNLIQSTTSIPPRETYKQCLLFLFLNTTFDVDVHTRRAHTDCIFTLVILQSGKRDFTTLCSFFLSALYVLAGLSSSNILGSEPMLLVAQRQPQGYFTSANGISCCVVVVVVFSHRSTPETSVSAHWPWSTLRSSTAAICKSHWPQRRLNWYYFVL